jgi:uncharacterized protein with PQ loop repeat
MGYHVSGFISALFVALSLTGLTLQLRFVWKRKRAFKEGRLTDEKPTSVISLNRFFTSFLAFYAMLMYGVCLTRFNHYLVWPRAIALGLLVVLLFEISYDRKDFSSTVLFFLSVFLGVCAVLLPLLGLRGLVFNAGVSQALVLFSAVLLGQGATHQILRIRRSGRTGGLSLTMHQLFFMKDVTSLIFGFVMGFKNGWPVLVFHGISLMVQCSTMWHFRWVKVSDVAAKRREIYDAVTHA